MRPKLKNSEDVNVVRSEAQAAKPVSGLGLLRCAATAIWAEVLGFRFGCPWEVVPEAGPISDWIQKGSRVHGPGLRAPSTFRATSPGMDSSISNSTCGTESRDT